MPSAITSKVSTSTKASGTPTVPSSPGTIYMRLVYEDGKQEVLTEKREFDDDKMAVSARGLEGHLMDQLKVYDVIFQFIPKTEQGCVCKVTMIWEQRRLARTHQLHEIRQELGCRHG
ncbi:hypothetical protein HID58_064906 [Brassica napus]|uniref:(rape) hypothetical protein n=1 Tax=Brassica napus TaxID=3708 RepID=A0A816L7F7_BRANA|nr:hypothetical protein HID58_064906 [Brassica napus]CAF1925732.1 unnamed protein product [Brassica napus]